MNVLGVIHPADLFREPRQRVPAMSDWSRIPRLLSGEWPLPIPPRIVVRDNDPVATIDAAVRWLDAVPATAHVAVDTEYRTDNHKLLLWGCAARVDGVVGGVQIEWPRLPLWARDVLCQTIGELMGRCPVVMQNMAADVPVVEQNMGIAYDTYRRLDDLMLAHALLWSEWPHSLEFIASLYSPYPKQKHLSQTDPLAYHWGDCIDTLASWEHVRRELYGGPE